MSDIKITVSDFSKILDDKPHLFQKFNEKNYLDLFGREKNYLSFINKQYNEDATFYEVKFKQHKKYTINSIYGFENIELEYIHHVILNYIIEGYTFQDTYDNRRFFSSSYNEICNIATDDSRDINRYINDLINSGLILPLTNNRPIHYNQTNHIQTHYCVNFARIKFLFEDKVDHPEIIDNQFKSKYKKTVETFLIKIGRDQKNVTYLLTHLIETHYTMNEELSDLDCFWIMGALIGLYYEDLKNFATTFTKQNS